MVLRSSCAGNRLPSWQICNLTAAAMPDLHPLVVDFPSRQMASVRQGLSQYRTVMEFSPRLSFEVLQSTWAARTTYERVEGRSVSKVDTFSFHLRHLPAFYAPARHLVCAGGLQNRSESHHVTGTRDG